jgi:hypothetical protein
MNGRLQTFLGFLDLLAEGQRRHAEAVTGRGFEPQTDPVPAKASNIVWLASPVHRESREEVRDTRTETYTPVRNTGIAAIVVAALAGIVSNSLALDQRAILERDVAQGAAVVLLPEVVVSASRLAQ